MISDHEFVVYVRDTLFPQVEKQHESVLNLLIRDGVLRGPLGMQGDSNEVNHTIQYLRAAANYLENMALRHHVSVFSRDR